MSILSRHRPAVKQNRITPRPEARFGEGLSWWAPDFDHRDHSADDERWLAEQDTAGPSDVELDTRAAEWELERRYEMSVAAGERCGGCGIEGPLGSDGLCDAGCQIAWDEAVHGVAE